MTIFDHFMYIHFFSPDFSEFNGMFVQIVMDFTHVHDFALKYGYNFDGNAPTHFCGLAGQTTVTFGKYGEWKRSE